VPVRRPGKFQFFRSHPDPEFCQIVELIDDDGDLYVPLDQNALLYVRKLIKPKRLQVYVDTFGDIAICPVSVIGDEDRPNRWVSSMTRILEQAKRRWTRAESNQNIQAYEAVFSEDDLGEPNWIELCQGKTFWDIFKIGFQDCAVDGINHPVIKRARGKKTR
jgi:hypothetical protein